MKSTMTVPVTIDLEVGGSLVSGRATLDAGRKHFEIEAQAVRHEDGSIDDWVVDLATARLLRRLELALMETVHERIDRSLIDE